MRFTAAHAAVFLIATAVTAAGIGLARNDRVRAPTTPWEETVSFCPGKVASPDVLFCDDFEDTDFQKRWDIGGHQGRWPIDE